MFRLAFSALRNIRPLSTPYFNAARIVCNERSVSKFTNVRSLSQTFTSPFKGILPTNNQQLLNVTNSIVQIPVRTVIKFSLKKGKRKTSKPVVKRFFRLHWGGWIRTKVGRQKKLWKKSSAQKRRLRQHVFCTAAQNTLLDKMVTKFWKKPKYYVDDPYAPYHTREEYFMTRKKPIQRN